MSGLRPKGRFGCTCFDCGGNQAVHASRTIAKQLLRKELVETVQGGDDSYDPWGTEGQDLTCYGDNFGPCDCTDCDPSDDLGSEQRAYELPFWENALIYGCSSEERQMLQRGWGR